MAQQVEYLKTENEILRRRLPKHIRTTPAERRLLIRAGKPLGATLKHLITFVAYSTFLGWLRDEDKTIGRRRKNGRPRTKESTTEIILMMARENHWGFRRIYAELWKLAIRKISPTTIKSILIAHGFDPCPVRPGASWADFIKRHAETLWACDFASKKILTKSGFVDCFVFFFIHVASRRVHIAGVTTCPSEVWMAQQARNLCMHFEEQSSKPILLLHDRDGKFTPRFKHLLASEGHVLHMLPVRSPNLNA
ncbi:MAG: hypothetical protein KIS92_05250 [Planctomycetota bacterium]|nr:hypothetical protein [Planctomycetota bacterium]